MSIGQQLLDVPFGEMVSSLGVAIAEAQCALDKNSIEILTMMGQPETVELPMVSVKYESDKGNNGILIEDKPLKTSMIGAGFQPTFYQFAETVIEVKIAISMNMETSTDVSYHTESSRNNRRKTRTRATTVDASYSSKYSYSAEGSSLLRTRLVPVPPNTVISQVIDMRNQAMNKIFQIESDKVTAEIEKASNDYDEAQKNKSGNKETAKGKS